MYTEYTKKRLRRLSGIKPPEKANFTFALMETKTKDLPATAQEESQGASKKQLAERFERIDRIFARMNLTLDSLEIRLRERGLETRPIQHGERSYNLPDGIYGRRQHLSYYD